MKKTITLKLILLSLIFFNTVFNSTFAQPTDEPTEVKTFEMSESGSLFVESSGGGVIVEGSDRSDIIVMAYVHNGGITVSSEDPMLSDFKENFYIIIEKSGTRVVARIERKTKGRIWNQGGVAFKVLTPREISCDLTSNGGGIRVSGVLGNHNFNSNGAGIRLKDVTGAIQANASGGGVTAENLKGSTKLISTSGDISLIKGEGDIFARSSAGGIKLENINGKIDAISIGGALTVIGASKSIVAQSNGGSIFMDIIGLSIQMNLKSKGGGIDATFREGDKIGLDLDLKSQKVNIDLANFSGIAKKDRVEGKSNGGGIPVYMRTSGGSINVKFE